MLLRDPKPLQLGDDRLQGAGAPASFASFRPSIPPLEYAGRSSQAGPNPPSCCIPTALHRFGRTIAKTGRRIGRTNAKKAATPEAPTILNIRNIRALKKGTASPLENREASLNPLGCCIPMAVAPLRPGVGERSDPKNARVRAREKGGG